MRGVVQIFSVLTLVVASACAYALSPLSSAIYGKVGAPITATASTEAATKTGRACANSVLGIVASGDASIDAAKRAGGITNVVSVDFESTNVLFLYATFCTIVRGS